MSHEEVSHNASHRSMRAAAKTVIAANRFSDAGRQMMAQKKAYGLTLTSPLHVPEPPSEFDGLTAFRAGPRRDPASRQLHVLALSDTGRVIETPSSTLRRDINSTSSLRASSAVIVRDDCTNSWENDRSAHLHPARVAVPRVSDPVSTAPHARSAGTSHEHLGLFAHYTGAPPTSHHYYAQARERARSPAPVPLSSGGRERARPRSSRARAFSLSLTSRARTDDRLSRLLRFAHTRRSGTPRSSAASSCSRASAAASTRPRARSSPTRSGCARAPRASRASRRRPRAAATTTTAGRRRRTRSTRTTRRSSRAARSRTARSSRTSTRRSAAIRWRRERERARERAFF